MELHYSDNSEAIDVLTKLDRELRALHAVLRASVNEVRVDALYGMKLRQSRDVRMSDPIEVRWLDGEEAKEAAIEALTSIQLKGQQSAKETLRAPGAIGLPTYALEKVVQTNALRNDLANLIAVIKEPKQRRLVWKKIEAVASMQALRTTHVLIDPQRIVFYWETGASGHRRAVGELIREWEKAVKGARDYMPTFDDFAEGAVERKLLVAIRRLSELDLEEHVYVTRPVTPHIRARFKDGDAKPKIVVAPIPFVYDAECPRPEIKGLESYTQSEKSNAGESRIKIQSEPWIETMNVYRYRDAAHRRSPK